MIRTDLNLFGSLTLALKRGRPGGSGGSSGASEPGGADDQPQAPIPKRVIAAIVIGLLLVCAGIFVFVISGSDPPEPTITGVLTGL